MKVMFLGDLAGTGFGTVTQDLGRQFIAQGVDVRFVSQNELGVLPEPFASRTISVNTESGWLALKEHGGIIGLIDGSMWPDGWVPDVALILGDYLGVYTAVMRTPETRAAFAEVPTFHYVPIEGGDLPPAWRPMWEIVHPVAMSEFGATEIAKITGSRPPVVYHGVDTAQFRPVSPERPIYIGTDDTQHKLRDKEDCKRMFGSNGRQTWVFRADRHMPRKMYPSFLRAMAPVVMERPDVFVVTHCRTDDEGGNIGFLRSKYCPEGKGALFDECQNPKHVASHFISTGFHDMAQGASRDILTALYNAADLYVSVSAEGFGLTIAEAIACGTPAVVLDYAASPEVAGPAGVTVPVQTLIDNEYDHAWARVDEKALTRTVLKLLNDDKALRALGRAGPSHVKANFQWSIAATQLVDIMAARAGSEVAA